MTLDTTAPADDKSLAALANRKSSTRKHKTLTSVGFKAVDATQGLCEAYVSIYGNVDSMGEVVDYGAFATSLKRKYPKVVWSHNWEKIIGKVTEAEEVPAGDPRLPESIKDKGGLRCVMKFNMEKQFARDCYSDLKGGYVDEFSIGYEEVDTYQSRDGRHLKELNLYEVSPVLAGANPATTVVDVKHKDDNTTSAEGATVVPAETKAEAEASAITVRIGSTTVTLTEKDLGERVTAELLKRAKRNLKAALPPHDTEIADIVPEWNEAAELTAAGANPAALKAMHAWMDPLGDPGDTRSYKFPHHKALGKVAPQGVRVASYRVLDPNLSDEDREGVKAHLAAHYGQFGEKAPWERAHEAIAGTEMLVRSRLEDIGKKGAVAQMVTTALPSLVVEAFYQAACMALMGMDPNAPVDPTQAASPVGPFTTQDMQSTLMALSGEMQGLLQQCFAPVAKALKAKAKAQAMATANLSAGVGQQLQAIDKLIDEADDLVDEVLKAMGIDDNDEEADEQKKGLKHTPEGKPADDKPAEPEADATSAQLGHMQGIALGQKLQQIDKLIDEADDRVDQVLVSMGIMDDDAGADGGADGEGKDEATPSKGRFKYGRVLSDRNLILLKQAHDNLGQMASNAGYNIHENSMDSDDDAFAEDIEDDYGEDTGEDYEDDAQDAFDDLFGEGARTPPAGEPGSTLPFKPQQPQSPTPGYFARVRDTSATTEKSEQAEAVSVVSDEQAARVDKVITRVANAEQAMHAALKRLGIDLELELKQGKG